MDNDTISRQAIIEKLQKNHDFFVNAYGGFENMPLTLKLRVDEITNCIAEVVNIPSVQPKQKTGRWIIRSDGYYPYCSQCSNEPQNRAMTKYCPNCGTKMESDDDDN